MLVLPIEGAPHLHVCVIAFKTCAWVRQATCPVCVLGQMVQAAEEGSQPFKDVTPAAALKQLRQVLEALGVQDAASYRCHDLRRGHALDLQLSGRSFMA